MPESTPNAARIVIVGGGVLGTMHAYAARNRGFEVVHLEREAGPRGASVRNFGLIWVSGRAAGPELALAQRARDLWTRIGGQIPALGFRPDTPTCRAGTPPTSRAPTLTPADAPPYAITPAPGTTVTWSCWPPARR